MGKKQKKMLARILVSAVLFAAGFFLPLAGWSQLVFYLTVYAIIGWDIVWKAVRNIAHGQVFDENFLMALATIGAFCLQEFPEAVEVMLFYQVGELFQSYAVGRSRQSIAALMDIRPDYANIERDGKLEQVDPDDVAVGDTISVRKPAKFVAKNFSGHTDPQDITEGSVSVKMDRFRDVTVAVTAKQMSMDIADFSQQVITPAMQAIAQAVDEDLLAVGVENAGYIKQGDPNASGLEDLADMAKKLDLNKVPAQNRNLVLHPTHKYRYALTENLSNVSYAGDNMTLRDALLGRIYTLDTYMDQNAPDTNASQAGTAAAFTVTGTKGESQVTLAGSGNVKAGDGFILDGYLYRFVEDGSASGTVKIDQELVEDVEGKEAVVITEPHSLGFHRNGLALVTRRVALPMGACKAAYAEADGLAVRVVYDYDSDTKTDKISFDIIYGIKALDKDMICVLKG